ncbi:MAG: HAMP domain-containing histidine kinase [Ignavibacteriales bacterium]|nr:HAMP domain-containing histidine kinase [Ignavibacteriales bacterium]
MEDNGIGIEDDHKEKKYLKIFYTSKKQGTGLGLSVCKNF